MMLEVCKLHSTKETEVIVTYYGFHCPICELSDDFRNLEKVLDKYEEKGKRHVSSTKLQ